MSDEVPRREELAAELLKQLVASRPMDERAARPEAYAAKLAGLAVLCADALRAELAKPPAAP